MSDSPVTSNRMTTETNKRPSIEDCEMNYAIDIKNIKPKDIELWDSFGVTTAKTFDVSCFSSVKYHCQQLSKRLRKDYPEYKNRIYAYRSTSRLPEGTTEVNKLRFVFSFVEKTKFIHVNVELHH